MALTDYKASEIFSGNDISSLSDRPNEDGITTPQLKARFDYLIKNMIPLHNSLINALIALLEEGNTTNGHTHNVDNLVDGVTNRLFTEVLRLKLATIAENAEVNQNAFSSIKVGATTGNADSKTATFEIVAGLNIVASIDPLTNKVTLSATGDISTLAVQSLLDDVGNYFNSLEVNGALQEIGASLYPTQSKTEPHDDDTMLIVDSQASGIFKKITWSNFKVFLSTLYANITHSHIITEVTGLEDALSGKASSTHTHDDRYFTESEVTTLLNGKATYTVYTATIPSASWTGSSAPFSKAITISGILSTDEPIIDLVLSGTYATDVTMRENWSKVYRIITSADTITCYADSVPSANINVQLVVVR